jgi:hypothetical protein
VVFENEVNTGLSYAAGALVRVARRRADQSDPGQFQTGMFTDEGSEAGPTNRSYAGAE